MIEVLTIAQRTALSEQVAGWRALQLSTQAADRPKAEAAARMLWPNAEKIVWTQGKLMQYAIGPDFSGMPQLQEVFGRRALEALGCVYYRLVPICTARSRAMGGNFSVPRLLYWKMVQEIHPFAIPLEHQLWLELAQCCGGVAVEPREPIKEFAINDVTKVKHHVHLADRPLQIHVRGDLLHRDDGPAVMYRDGTLGWFTGGVKGRKEPLPPEWSEQPERWLTEMDITSTIRTINMVGLEKAYNLLLGLAQRGATWSNKQPFRMPGIPMAVHVKSARGEMVKFLTRHGAGGILKLLDPATKEYCYLVVPGWTPIQQGGPRASNVVVDPWGVDDALAWTFGLNKGEYNPVKET